MHIVVKNTKTVAEFKQHYAEMEEKALKHFEAHKQAFEVWREGEIVKVWLDAAGTLCVQYESGNWWHYNDAGEWW